MTDQQSYDMRDGTPMLTIERQETTPTVLLIRLPIVSDHDSVAIASRRLLAMIDTTDPDAMRAYLRETSETQLDGIDAVAAGISRQIIAEREVPEADSPEDVDERPGRDDPTERAQIDRAWAMEHAAAVLGRLVAATGAESGELPVTGYASWILTGSTETLDR